MIFKYINYHDNHHSDQDVEHREHPSRCVPSQMMTPKVNHYSDLFLPWISIFFHELLFLDLIVGYRTAVTFYPSVHLGLVYFSVCYTSIIFKNKMVLWPMAPKTLPRNCRIFLRHVLSIGFFHFWYYRCSSWFYGYYFMSLSV